MPIGTVINDCPEEVTEHSEMYINHIIRRTIERIKAGDGGVNHEFLSTIKGCFKQRKDSSEVG